MPQTQFAVPNQTPTVVETGRRNSGPFADKKPDSYINLALPNGEGTTTKLDRAIRLDHSDPHQKMLFDLLQTAEGVERFKAALVVSCNSGTAVDRGGFVL
jgi:hypothetical protein